MCKIALVGHCHIPRCFHFPDAQVEIFCFPAAKATSFLKDPRMSKVLNWEHDLTITWIGRNDITSNTNPEVVFNHIKEICHAFEVNCQSVVYVCQVKLRLSPRNISSDQYRKIQCGINNKIKKKLKVQNINFNNLQFVEELAEDGVHWSEDGLMRTEAKFRKVIKGFIGEDNFDE